MNVLRHAVSILGLPFTVTVVIPAAALLWRGEPYVRLDAQAATLVAAAAAIPLALVVWAIALFATTGQGTLAPWAPPERLVVAGPFRHVRNPMLTGVIGLLLAVQAITQSGAVAVELALFLVVSTTMVPIVEERGLLARFGDEYATFARNVPRWLPRLAPWTGGDDGVPRRAPDDLLLATIPRDRARGLIAVHVVAVVALVALVVAPLLPDGPGVRWLLGAGAVTWALLDLRDAWADALRDPPPPLVFGRMHDDGKTFELRESPGGRPVAGWRFIRRDAGAFVLMRRRLASRALVKGVRPKERPFRMAVAYEPRGRPDDEGWIRYPASAAWEDPPGEWRSVRA